MGGVPWGGSEELWSRTALRLGAQGFPVSASVVSWSPPHPRVQELAKQNIELQVRSAKLSLWARAWRKVMSLEKLPAVLEVERLLTRHRPALVIFSDGGPFSNVELLEVCLSMNLPFITIGQANSHNYWMDDAHAERCRRALTSASKCYFVSHANLLLAERQLGCKLNNAEIVWNPFNVEFDAHPPWPRLENADELRLACVARLHPPSKGQDILLEALARNPWSTRQWRLTFYGEGPMQDIIERLAQTLGISDRVTFAGYARVKDIWSMNHILVMPSRYEGMPLAMVEAMLCGRAVLATDVAGHSEIIENDVTGFLVPAPTVEFIALGLERVWSQRESLQQMGRAGSERIRTLVPRDPVQAFVEKVKSTAEGSPASNIV
jgi:glycosyltransferase involved in cell wall biosynthesis